MQNFYIQQKNFKNVNYSVPTSSNGSTGSLFYMNYELVKILGELIMVRLMEFPTQLNEACSAKIYNSILTQ